MASGAFLAGTIIQGLLFLNYPSSYVFERWHGTLLFYAIASLGFFFQHLSCPPLTKDRAILFGHSQSGLFWNLDSFDLPLLHMVLLPMFFENFKNGGGRSTTELSFLVGFSTSLYMPLSVNEPPFPPIPFPLHSPPPPPPPSLFLSCLIII